MHAPTASRSLSFIAATLLVGFLGCAAAPKPAVVPHELFTRDDGAEADLELAVRIEQPLVGLAEQPSELVQAFRTLLAAPDSAARFRRLLAKAHIGGQLYALCGLYLVAPSDFGSALQRVWDENPDQPIESVSFDTVETTTVRDVLGAAAPFPAPVEALTPAGIASGATCHEWARDPCVALEQACAHRCRGVEQVPGVCWKQCQDDRARCQCPDLSDCPSASRSQVGSR